jgi:WhiB family redox-sensing transcriptional regulator
MSANASLRLTAHTIPAEPPHRTAPDAACTQPGINPDLFFPERETGWRVDAAKRICNSCPHQQACAEWAITTCQDYGIYGGLTPTERTPQALAAARQRPPKPPPPPRASRRPHLDQTVADLHRQEKTDAHIALVLGVSADAVRDARHRLGLPALYGPGGRRLTHTPAGPA